MKYKTDNKYNYLVIYLHTSVHFKVNLNYVWLNIAQRTLKHKLRLIYTLTYLITSLYKKKESNLVKTAHYKQY